MKNNKIEVSFKEYLSEIYDQPKKLHKSYRMFHRYSAGNRILAESQMLNPGPINTYKGWQKLGRQVIKGSRAISLFLPISIKMENDKGEGDLENVAPTRFVRKKYWFSLSQTKGEDFQQEILPDFDMKKALESLEIVQERFSIVNGNCQGYAIADQNIIAINPVAYAPYKTTIHEIAHCLLHKESGKIIDGAELETSIKEFEAETTAYLVCCFLGKFDHLEYSRGYIANWIKREDIEEDNFRRAFDAANKILEVGFI